MLQAKKPRLTSAIKLIDVRLEQAELDLKRTKVTAPIDGMVVVESVEENAYVQKGTPLVTIEDTSAVEVRCHLRMDELPGCAFPPEAERTYNRSKKYFVQVYGR